MMFGFVFSCVSYTFERAIVLCYSSLFGHLSFLCSKSLCVCLCVFLSLQLPVLL